MMMWYNSRQRRKRTKSAKGVSRTFAAAYPKAVCQCVTPDDYASLLM